MTIPPRASLTNCRIIRRARPQRQQLQHEIRLHPIRAIARAAFYVAKMQVGILMFTVLITWGCVFIGSFGHADEWGKFAAFVMLLGFLGTTFAWLIPALVFWSYVDVGSTSAPDVARVLRRALHTPLASYFLAVALVLAARFLYRSPGVWQIAVLVIGAALLQQLSMSWKAFSRLAQYGSTGPLYPDATTLTDSAERRSAFINQYGDDWERPVLITNESVAQAYAISARKHTTSVALAPR